jgi:hypothetical protein
VIFFNEMKRASERKVGTQAEQSLTREQEHTKFFKGTTMKNRMMTLITCIAIAASQLVGCGDTLPQDEAIASFDAELVWVDAEMMDTLNGDERLILDLNQENLVYAVNLQEVDPSRIEVRDVNQPGLVLSTLIADQAEVQGYAGAPLERIVLTARLENFASLASWEIAILEEEGYYQSEVELIQGAGEDLASVEGAIKIEIYFRLFGWGVCIKIETKGNEEPGGLQSGSDAEEADEDKGSSVTVTPTKSKAKARAKK